jgi:urease accessory protein
VRAFRGPTGQALVHLNNTSGGILGGDRLDLRAELAPGARAQITTTGATRIYRSRAGALESLSTAHFELAEDTLLELLPDPVIPFAGSRFAQSTTVNLAAGATLFWWEILAPGREAAGEVFAFEDLRIETEIRAGGFPIAIDRMHLQPQARPLESPARMGPYRHLASLYVCRAGEPAATWRSMEEQLGVQNCACTEQPDGVVWGIGLLTCDGLVIRGMSRSGAALVAGLREFWRAARLLLTGEPASLPRKIY